MDDNNALIRRALEEYAGHRSGSNVSIRCPLSSCAGSRKANLSIHDNGPWKCWRCGATGFLKERGDVSLPDRRKRVAAAAAAIAVKAESASQIFERCSSIYPGDVVDKYLRSRLIVPVASIWWPEDLRKGWLKHPTGVEAWAMVAAVRNVAGDIVGIHRTFLTDAGTQAELQPVKMSFGAIKGGAVRLAAGLERLCIGEGIETTMRAAPKVAGVTPWSALSAAGMASLELPAETREIWVAPDMDDHGKNPADDFRRNVEVSGRLDAPEKFIFGCVGVEAAFHLIRRAQSAGIIAHLMPPYGKDHAE